MESVILTACLTLLWANIFQMCHSKYFIWEGGCRWSRGQQDDSIDSDEGNGISDSYDDIYGVSYESLIVRVLISDSYGTPLIPWISEGKEGIATTSNFIGPGFGLGMKVEVEDPLLATAESRVGVGRFFSRMSENWYKNGRTRDSRV